MEILARAVGRRKEAVAQVQIIRGTGKFIINNKLANQYLQNNEFSMISVQAPFSCFTDEKSPPNPPISPVLTNNSLVFSPPAKKNGLLLSTVKKKISQELPLPPKVLLKEQDIQTFGLGAAQQPFGHPVPKPLEAVDTIVKVKGGGLIGQAEAIKLAIARALCLLKVQTPPSPPTPWGGSQAVKEGVSPEVPKIVLPAEDKEGTPQGSLGEKPLVFDVRKSLKIKGYLTQDSRVKERRKYGLKKARKASQYHKR